MAKQTHYESIMEGLQQAIDFEKGDTSKGRIRIVEIPEIEPLNEYPKEKLGVSSRKGKKSTLRKRSEIEAKLSEWSVP